MQGKVLAFDFPTGTGAITGNDGNRYVLEAAEWKNAQQPRVGQVVDFALDGSRATEIYPAVSAGTTGEKNRIVAALLAFFWAGWAFTSSISARTVPG